MSGTYRRAKLHRPRILIVAQRLPRPVRGGGDLRVNQTLAAARTAGETGLMVLSAPAGEHRLDRIPTWVPQQPESSDPQRAASASAAWLQTPDGHPSDRWWTQASASALRRALGEHRPDVVILEHLWSRHAVAPAREAGAAVVLNAHNVEAQVHDDMLESGASSILPRLLAERTAAIERATVASVDQVWAVSDEDIGRFRSRYAACAPLRLVPNGIDTAAVRLRDAEPSEPSVLFPGSFGYPPNVTAAQWLAREVLPRARERRPGLRLLLAGSGPPAALLELSRADPAVLVTGAVDETAPLFHAASAVAVPITVGGGSRYKILEAFANGAPVVSTAKGIEGIDARPGSEYLPAELADEFSDAIVRLCSEPSLSRELARQARRLVQERYSWDSAAVRIRAALEELASG